MVRNGRRRPPLIHHRLWASYALALELTSICRPRLSGNMLVGLERQRHTVTAIQRMETTCGIVATPAPRLILLDRRARIRGDSTTCMEMLGSGALTGMAFWRTVQIPWVSPRRRDGRYVAAAGTAMRSTAPRPTGTVAFRQSSTAPMVSVLSEPCQNETRNHAQNYDSKKENPNE